MADIVGVKVADLTAAGASDDGGEVWITHRLGDGSEYSLVYPYEAIGYLLTAVTAATRSAYRRRASRNPHEAVEGMDSNVIPIAEARIGTPKDKAGAILHLTTADRIPIAVELPARLLADIVQQLQNVLDRQNDSAAERRQLH